MSLRWNNRFPNGLILDLFDISSFTNTLDKTLFFFQNIMSVSFRNEVMFSMLCCYDASIKVRGEQNCQNIGGINKQSSSFISSAAGWTTPLVLNVAPNRNRRLCTKKREPISNQLLPWPKNVPEKFVAC